MSEESDALSEIRLVLSMSPEDVLDSGAHKDPGKYGMPRANPNEREQLLLQIAIDWRLCTSLVSMRRYADALELMTMTGRRATILGSVFGEEVTQELDSLRQLLQAMSCNLECFMDD